MIGLDTSAIIDIFKGEEKIKQFLEDNKEPLAATMMSYLELFFGLDPGNPNHAEEGSYYDEFFKSVYNIDMTKNSCKEASKIFYNLKKQGKTIEQFDCAIAAMFLANGIRKIITRNAKHFENIRQLAVISY
ncbi:type II toxin-antitoxin system VapC family toxin [Candidatus Woesearchaeota archaeon]|nr:type II toxin-antitoxin system VapC family toxin [Candidatus Woesearchaeota archaeon]